MNRAAVTITLSIAIAACSGNGGSTLPPGGAVKPSPTGAAAAAHPTPTAVNAPRGSISLYSGTYLIGNSPKQISTVGAGFYTDSTVANATDCVSATFGPCSVSSHCTPLAAAAAPSMHDAGEISISGGTNRVVLAPTADRAYRTVTDGSSLLWNGGELLTITASGGAVPPFATTIVAPSALALSSPANATRGIAIDRNADWTIAWTPSSVGNVTLVVQLKNQAMSIQCQFPASAGAGTVSKEALRTSISGAVGVVALAVGNTQQLSVGAWNVDVSANAPVIQDGQLANIIPVTLR